MPVQRASTPVPVQRLRGASAAHTTPVQRLGSGTTTAALQRSAAISPASPAATPTHGLRNHPASATGSRATQPPNQSPAIQRTAQRAVPINRPAAASSTAALPLPMASRAPAAPRPSAGAPIQRTMTDLVTAAAGDTRRRFSDTVDDQVGGFTDKIADLRDAAALVRDPSRFRQVAKQRGIEMFAEANPIAGAVFGQRHTRSEGGPGSRGGSGRAPGRGEHQEMELLAEKLVAPLARLLRTELRMDRERMGRLRDSGR